MKNDVHSENEDSTKAPMGEPATQEKNDKNQPQHKSPNEEFITKRFQEISNKSPQEMTAFDLVFLFAKQFPMCRIHGILHGFNGKYYYPIDRQGLEAKILEVLFDILDKRGDIRIISSLVYIIERFPMLDYEESSEWVGFANGVLNIRNWLFYEHSQLVMRVEQSNGVNFPQPSRLPTTPPEHPIITYNLQTSFNWTFLPTISDTTHPFRMMPTPVADYFFYEIAGMDYELIARIYEMIGYLLVPDTDAKAFFLLQGVPDSGKSVLGRFLEGFFPSQCVTALDISRLGGQFLPDALATSRLNLSMDLPDGLLSKKAVAMIKMLTGNDLITHEAKYKDAKPFRGQCKFLFSINGKLKMTGRDTAFLDRIVCIPFRHSVPKAQRDDHLLQKLNEERENIMMNALEYYRAFVARNRVFSGDYTPEIEYRLSPNDTITEFVSDMCILQESEFISTEELYSAYTSFCRENKLKAVPSKSGFSQRLFSLYPGQISPHRQHTEGSNLRGYYGITLGNDQYSYDEADDDEYYDDCDEYDEQE